MRVAGSGVADCIRCRHGIADDTCIRGGRISMKALVLHKQLAFDPAYPNPRPQPGECVVRVHAAGINSADLQLIRNPGGFRGIPGHEFVGTVISGSVEWRGRRVVGEIDCVCARCDMCLAGLAAHCRSRTAIGLAGRDGCFAEQLAIPERNLHVVPDSISDEEAVFVHPLAAAYQVGTKCRIDGRTKLAVIGAGRLGILVACVLARSGCRLTAIGRNRHKLLVCEKQGIQTEHVDECAPRQDFDVVVECSGSPAGLGLAMRLVRPRGTVVLQSVYGAGDFPAADAAAGEALRPADLATLVTNEVTVFGSRGGSYREAILALERREIDVRPLVSRTYPLDQFTAVIRACAEPEVVKVLLRVSLR